MNAHENYRTVYRVDDMTINESISGSVSTDGAPSLKSGSIYL